MEAIIPYLVILATFAAGFLAGIGWAEKQEQQHKGIRVVVNKKQEEPPGLPIHYAEQMTVMLNEADLDTFAEKLSIAVHGEKDE